MKMVDLKVKIPSAALFACITLLKSHSNSFPDVILNNKN